MASTPEDAPSARLGSEADASSAGTCRVAAGSWLLEEGEVGKSTSGGEEAGPSSAPVPAPSPVPAAVANQVLMNSVISRRPH